MAHKIVSLTSNFNRFGLDDGFVSIRSKFTIAQPSSASKYRLYTEVDTPQELQRAHSTIKRDPLLRILTFGEADYSFAWALKQSQPYSAMVATRYESNSSKESPYRKLQSNIRLLQNSGAALFKGIDATQLKRYPFKIFQTQNQMNGTHGFEKIYFNFPYPPEGYGGNFERTKVQIQELLKAFIDSAIPLLTPRGQILIGGFNNRMEYYQPNGLTKDRLIYSAVTWDTAGLLQHFGYEHRRSSSDRELAQPTNNTATLMRFQVSRGLGTQYFMKIADISEEEANAIIKKCTQKGFLDENGNPNPSKILERVHKETIFKDFASFGLSRAIQIQSTLIGIAYSLLSNHLTSGI